MFLSRGALGSLGVIKGRSSVTPGNEGMAR